MTTHGFRSMSLRSKSTRASFSRAFWMTIYDGSWQWPKLRREQLREHATTTTPTPIPTPTPTPTTPTPATTPPTPTPTCGDNVANREDTPSTKFPPTIRRDCSAGCTTQAGYTDITCAAGKRTNLHFLPNRKLSNTAPPRYTINSVFYSLKGAHR